MALKIEEGVKPATTSAGTSLFQAEYARSSLLDLLKVTDKTNVRLEVRDKKSSPKPFLRFSNNNANIQISVNKGGKIGDIEVTRIKNGTTLDHATFDARGKLQVSSSFASNTTDPYAFYVSITADVQALRKNPRITTAARIASDAYAPHFSEFIETCMRQEISQTRTGNTGVSFNGENMTLIRAYTGNAELEFHTASYEITIRGHFDPEKKVWKPFLINIAREGDDADYDLDGGKIELSGVTSRSGGVRNDIFDRRFTWQTVPDAFKSNFEFYNALIPKINEFLGLTQVNNAVSQMTDYNSKPRRQEYDNILKDFLGLNARLAALMVAPS